MAPAIKVRPQMSITSWLPEREFHSRSVIRPLSNGQRRKEWRCSRAVEMFNCGAGSEAAPFLSEDHSGFLNRIITTKSTL